MIFILNILPYIQITLAVLLVAFILLQPTDADAGGSFGGGAMSTWHTRRGGERVLFIGTIVIAVLFVASVLLDLWK